ncbi:hypothetical protein ZIOFF_069907 [Zingiber officinale]|uniref:Uncharacterized protein n=1 Tax=Zingiber officinale TaxID=94328 RepID=A0A8J5C6N3_ZINOF|nr:hypothetical protein ZIOFF_069907 [Zingiber officinale]
MTPVRRIPAITGCSSKEQGDSRCCRSSGTMAETLLASIMNKVNLIWQFCITSKLSTVILPLLKLTIIWGMLSKTLDMLSKTLDIIGHALLYNLTIHKHCQALATYIHGLGNYAEVIACYKEVLRRLLLMVLSIEGTHLRRLVELLKQFRLYMCCEYQTNYV